MDKTNILFVYPLIYVATLLYLSNAPAIEITVPNYLISNAKNDQDTPLIAYNSKRNEYLVVWNDERNKNVSGKDIFGKILDSKLEPKSDAFPINNSPNDQYAMNVVYNNVDDQYLVIWKDETTGNIEGQIVTSSGDLLGEKINITNSARSRTSSLAFNTKDNNYLVIWDEGDISQNSSDIYGQMLSRDGRLQGGKFPITISAFNQYNPAIVYNSTDNEFLVVWQDERNTVGDVKYVDIYCKRITGLGQLISGDMPISDINSVDYKQLPSVAYNKIRNEYLVVWTQGKSLSSMDIHSRFVKNDGIMEGNILVLCSAYGKQSNPDVAYNDRDMEYLVVWEDGRGSNSDIYGQKLSQSGQLIESNFAISTAPEDQYCPKTTFNSFENNYVVVWSDNRNKIVSASDICAQVIDSFKEICHKGDVNGDGIVNSKDAMLVLQFIVGLKTLTDLQKCSADVIEDGEIKANDAIKILQMAVGMNAPEKNYIRTDNPVISIGEVQNISESSFSIPIMINNASDIAGGVISVIFDDSVIRVSEVLSDGLFVWNIAKSGSLRIAFVNPKAIDQNLIAEINFDIIENRFSKIDLSDISIYNSSGKQLMPKVINGEFCPYSMSVKCNGLFQNFPNPFNPETWIPYQLKIGSDVLIKIYNMNGDLIRELDLGYKSAGLYTSQGRSAYWDGKDKYGNAVASGIYFYSIQAGDFFDVRKMVVLR